MGSPRNELSRALAFMASVDEEVASEVREWSGGTALITPELPRVWDASYFRVEDASATDSDQMASECVRIAREAGLAHAAVVVIGDDAGASLGPPLLRAGFEETRFVIMALRRPPPAPELEIAEVSFDDVAPSRRELTLEFFPGDEALADQLRSLDRRLEATIGGRWFAVREGHEVISRAWLMSADGVGQVEDVATASTHRGRGLGRAVVSAAARASQSTGDDLTFVIADAGETTPDLYRKTGFEPLGHKRRFVKRLPS